MTFVIVFGECAGRKRKILMLWHRRFVLFSLYYTIYDVDLLTSVESNIWISYRYHGYRRNHVGVTE